MSRKSKRSSFDGEPFIAHRLSMRESVAWRHLPDNARRVLDRLEREHAGHGGSRNGSLVCTFDDFEEAGLRRKAIAPAIRSCVALGFLAIEFHARPAMATHRRGHEFRLTYMAGRSPSPDPTHDWRLIETDDQAAQGLRRAAAERSDDHVRRADKARRPRTLAA